MRVAAETITVSVDARRGPWDYTNGGLNTLFQYGMGDQQSPLVVTAADGFDFSPWRQFYHHVSEWTDESRRDTALPGREG